MGKQTKCNVRSRRRARNDSPRTAVLWLVMLAPQAQAPSAAANFDHTPPTAAGRFYLLPTDPTIASEG